MGYAAELFTWNLAVLTHFGYLDRNKRLRAFLIISLPVMTIFPGAYNIYFNSNDFGETIFNFSIISAHCSTIVRAFAIIYNQSKFSDIYKVVDNWYYDMQHDDDKRALEKLQQFTKNARRFSKYALLTGASIAVFTAFEPILTNYGKFILEIALPNFDFHQSPIYEVCYLLQVFWIYPVDLCSYLSYVNSLLIFISFGNFMLRDLQQKLESLCQMDEENALTNMKKCIKLHSKIIKFRDDLDELFSATCLVDVSLYCIVICMMLFYSTMGGELMYIGTIFRHPLSNVIWNETAFGVVSSSVLFFVLFSLRVDYEVAAALRGLTVIFSSTVLIFLTFWLASTFSDESLNIAHAAYATNWMERDMQFRKCVLLMIARSQRPLQLTAGGFKPLTMEVFLAIMRASYSLFSLLQSTT